MKSIIQNSRFLTLLVGLTSITVFTIGGSAASQYAVLRVDQNLNRYWRTTYDILVRPQNTRSPIEIERGLVAANHISGIDGGISFQQYELIRSIPGVETAAPVAMLGYIRWLGEAKGFRLPDQPGAYFLETTFQTGDGTPARDDERSYYFISPGEETTVITDDDFPFIGLYVNPPANFAATSFQTGLLVAGIDPSQEAKLIGLENAMIEGEYLKEHQPLIYPRTRPCRLGDNCPATEVAAPLLISASVYVDEIARSTLKQLDLDAEFASLEELLSRGGFKYLVARPGEVIGTQETDGEWVHQNIVEGLKSHSYSTAATLYGLPTPLEYREITYALMEYQLALEIVMPDIQSDERCPTCLVPRYRLLVRGNDMESMRDSRRLNAFFSSSYVGTFNIEHLPKPFDVNRVPLETYFPPVAILRYDEQGDPVDPPKELYPTTNAAGYIQSPPLILTTLETVRVLRDEEAISAIRVRVALEGCPGDYLTCLLTPQNQRKIETIQKRVQAGHLLLLGALLSIGGLFVLDLSWADVVARRRTIALQKALGWRSSTVFFQVLGHLLLASTLAATLSVPIAWGITRLIGWPLPALRLLAGVPLLVVVLSLLGGLYPAWLAASTPPVIGLQQGSIRHNRSGAPFLPFVRLRASSSHFSLLPSHFSFLSSHFFLFAWQGLARRWSRSVLGALTAALSAALLVLMLAVTIDRQGAMSGTLLGEFILVRIESYHYAIVTIGFGLAALSLANSLLAGVLERRREIGVLKAVGWRTPTVARLFVLEGVLLGLLGGLAGTALGLTIFVGLYETFSAGVAWIGLVGVLTPVVVGALAALYPARVAAHVLPAEAVRYE